MILGIYSSDKVSISLILLLIVRIGFLFNQNPLLSSILIAFLTFLFILKTDKKIIISDTAFELHLLRLFSFMSVKKVIEFKYIEMVDYDKPEIFYPGYVLGATSAILSKKKGSLIFKLKDGTYQKIILLIKKSEQKKIFEILSERINKKETLIEE